MQTAIRTFLLLLALTASAAARIGVVETRDHRLYEGHIRIESNSVAIVDASAGLWVHVPLTNLAALTLENEQAPFTVYTLPTRPMTTEFLPPPWRNEDIGSAMEPGNATFAWEKFHLKSAGTNIGAGNDAFHFVFKSVRGSSELVARVGPPRGGDLSARAGLMMRASLSGDSPNVFVGMNAAKESFVQWRKETGKATEGISGPGTMAGRWFKLKRSGDGFAAYQSRDGRQWTLLHRVEAPLSDAMFVGLAATGGRWGLTHRSIFDEVQEAPALRNRWFVPRVALKGGSVASGYVVEMNDSIIRFQDESGSRAVSTDAAASLSFQFVPDRWSALVASGRPGVLLASGQFIDGECRGISEGTVTLSSIPLGLCRFDINHEVIAVVLRKPSAAGEREYFIRTVDGSVWFGSSLTFEGQGVVLREPGLGIRRIALHDLLELRRRS